MCNEEAAAHGEIGYDMPARLHLGLVATPFDRLRLEAFGGWVGWSAFTEYDIILDVPPGAMPRAANPEAASELISQHRLWARDNNDTFFAGLDGKIRLGNRWLTGARALFDRHAIPARVLSSNNYDADTLALSGLVAFSPVGPLTVGLSAEQLILARRVVKRSGFGVTLDEAEANPDRTFYASAAGSYSGRITRLGLSVMVRFGADRDGE